MSNNEPRPSIKFATPDPYGRGSPYICEGRCHENRIFQMKKEDLLKASLEMNRKEHAQAVENLERQLTESENQRDYLTETVHRIDASALRHEGQWKAEIERLRAEAQAKDQLIERLRGELEEARERATVLELGFENAERLFVVASGRLVERDEEVGKLREVAMLTTRLSAVDVNEKDSGVNKNDDHTLTPCKNCKTLTYQHSQKQARLINLWKIYENSGNLEVRRIFAEFLQGGGSQAEAKQLSARHAEAGDDDGWQWSTTDDNMSGPDGRMLCFESGCKVPDCFCTRVVAPSRSQSSFVGSWDDEEEEEEDWSTTDEDSSEEDTSSFSSCSVSASSLPELVDNDDSGYDAETESESRDFLRVSDFSDEEDEGA